MTSSDVQDYISSSLGAPTITVELDQNQYNTVIEATLSSFSTYLPREVVLGYHCPQGVTAMPYGDSSASGVLWVDFTDDDTTFEGIDIDAAMLSNPWAFISTGMPSVEIFDYELQRHWLELLGRTFANEPWYHIDDIGEKLLVWCPYAKKVSVTWKVDYTGVEQIKSSHQMLFKNIALAKARQIVGLIRSKYSGVPGAGSIIQLDGRDMFITGKQDEERLMLELQNKGGYYIPQLA